MRDFFIVEFQGYDHGERLWIKRGGFQKCWFHKPKKSISVKFDRQAVLDAIGCPSAKETTLTVRGEILHGDQTKAFEATGVIRLKMKKNGSCSAD